MKIKIIKFIQCGPCFINGLKFQEISFFETFYIVIRHLVFVTLIYFLYISTYGVCDKNLGPKINCLDIFYESLNFFFLKRQSFGFFQDLIIILKLVQI
jgi:hypothetical protein